MTFRPGLSGGGDAAAPTPAAYVKNAVALVDAHGFDQGAGAVVKASIGEDSGAGQEAQRRAFANPRVECDLVPPAWPLAVTRAPKDCSLGDRGMHPAKHLF